MGRIKKISIYIIKILAKMLFWLVLLLVIFFWFSQTPTLYRDWQDEDKILQRVDFIGDDKVEIIDMRNFHWEHGGGYEAEYFSAEYDLPDLQSLHYILVPFSKYDGPAHSMLDFGFSDGRHVVISAELRKEKGETFNPIFGILNQYEMQYVIGTQTDLIRNRTHVRNNTVYMYPIKADGVAMQKIFMSMLIKADRLSREPEFYNTLWNNCTTSLVKHVNHLLSDKLPYGKYTTLPANSDKILYKYGLIDTEINKWSNIRQNYRIDQKLMKYKDEGDYAQVLSEMNAR